MKIERHNKLFLKGFTLLELIVAVTLMNLIALTLYSSMYIGVKAKKSVTEVIKPYRTVIPAFDQIKKDLQSVMRPTGLLAGNFQGDDGVGLNKSDTLCFHCCSFQPADDQKASNIVLVEYVIGTDSQTKRTLLVRRITTNLLSSKTAGYEDEIVCSGIVFLDFKYYDGFNWVDSWDSTTRNNELPYAVKVSLSIFKDSDNVTNENKDDKAVLEFTKIISLSFLSTNQDESLNEL